MFSKNFNDIVNVMEGYDYDAAARTVEIEDITSDAINREILRKLKDNDPNFDKLWVREDGDCGGTEYFPEGARELGWVGYYIGNNTSLKALRLTSDMLVGGFNNDIDQFFRGVNINRSIQKISFHSMDLSGGEIFQSLRPFFENNHNLSEFIVEHCVIGAACARQFSMALGVCNKSLKFVRLEDSHMGEARLVEIIEALSVHTQLEKLILWRMNIGTNECTALANLLRGTSELQTLDLSCNAIDDGGVDALVGVLTNSRLQHMYLSSNRITAGACQSLAVLLTNMSSNLEELSLYRNNIGNEGALILSNALTSNRKLKELDLEGNGITVEGWSSFSKVLCDTSSVNNTFHSNHTLGRLGTPSISADLRSLLTLNRSSEDKKEVAIKKIIKHHHHFVMQPFFEWDLKVLPIAINWFETAQSIVNDKEEETGKLKLGVIYQFIRAMPEVFEPVPAAA